MKAILRSASLVVVCLTALGCLSSFATAQDPCEDADGISALDTKIRENYGKDETVAVAVQSAKQYLQKYGACEPTRAFAEWLGQRLPAWEERAWRWPRSVKFLEGIKNKKYDDVYAAGAELVQRYPENVQYLLPLGLIGLRESYENNFKYNDNSIKYAKLALTELKSGSAEPRKKDGKPVLDTNGKEVFGIYPFERNAEDAVSELNYSLAYILYHVRKDRKAGLLYYYETSLIPGPFRSEPRLYATIGQYYRQESMPIGEAIKGLIKELEAAKTDEEKAKLDAQIKGKIALHNGYLERALGGFSLALKFAKARGPSEKALQDEMLAVLKLIHQLREPAVPLDDWIAAASQTPLPDPASEVKPVFDPEPLKATPSSPAKPVPASKPRPRPSRDARKPTI
jgi:hypothetical protein